MLPQVGSSELFLIAIIALIVIGPKDLPVMLRKLGKVVGRLRGMANEFRSSFDEMARQSELDDLRKEVAAMREAAISEQAAVGEQMTALENSIHTGPQMIDDARYDPSDPEFYPRYPETQAQKIINRKKRVAEAEGAAAKKPARKTVAKVPPPTVTKLAAPPPAPRKASTKAKAPANSKTKADS